MKHLFFAFFDTVILVVAISCLISLSLLFPADRSYFKKNLVWISSLVLPILVASIISVPQLILTFLNHILTFLIGYQFYISQAEHIHLSFSQFSNLIGLKPNLSFSIKTGSCFSNSLLLMTLPSFKFGNASTVHDSFSYC